MIYLRDFYFARRGCEEDFLSRLRRTCYTTYYPFQVFPAKELEHIELADVTIFYGGNGSGKTTALNVIADAISAERNAPYNKTNFWPDYLNLCRAEFENESYVEKRILTSDDIFDYMLDIRHLNERIDTKREDRFDEYLDYKYSSFRFESMDQLDELKRRNLARSRSQSEYVRKTLIDNVREFSNGESAYRYFTSRIDHDAIYILDEPENSLSPKFQLELVRFLEDSARFYNCQFIIATHSPFILSMRGACVYDLDTVPVAKRSWTELESMQTYYRLFMERAEEFKEKL